MAAPYRRIGMIGSGRVARALGLALNDHSAQPLLVWGRDRARADAAARDMTATGGEGAGSGAQAVPDIASIMDQCDAIAIAVADDAIAPVVSDLARMRGAGRPFLFHLSGASGTALLEPLHLRGARVAAIHPAMTFTGQPREEVARMKGACFAVTAPTAAARAEAERIVAMVEGRVVAVAEDRRPLYHAALSHAANHLVTLVSGSCRALAVAGVEDPAALLAPLVRAALENTLEKGFAALSGPVLRGDRASVARHLDTLAAHDPGLLPAYRAMALATLDELERTGAGRNGAGIRAELTGGG